MRKMEAFIIALVVVIAASFLIQLVYAKPNLGEVVKGFVPTKLNKDALYIAVGIIGATVMPHNLYLHSALVQTRKIKHDRAGIKRALKYNFIDSAIALNAAFVVNAAILILAASVFFTTGHTSVAKIADAHKLLAPMLGTKLAPLLFAVALIAAGQSSTVTGTLAGQIVMEGYLSIRINPLLRRLLTRLIAIIPALITILIFGDDKLDGLLVLSQVVLSLQLGFAIIPLIHFVSDKSTMGEFVIKLPVKITAWIVATILVFLNAKLVVESTITVFDQNEAWIQKVGIIAAGLVFSWLFIMMTFLPLLKKSKEKVSFRLHGDEKLLQNLAVPSTQTIAVALDFGNNDDRMIAYAIAQGKHQANYLLLHIVETVSATYLGASSDDYETRKDQQRLALYASQLNNMGYSVTIALGYQNRIYEMVRLVKEANADLLVMGAHRHSGLKDILYGETVDKVRHKVNIPVLIVNE